VHFVSPSLWAWRGERIHGIAQAVSRMLVVFPFEQEIYEQAGIPVSYVGHPLADALPLEPDQASARRALDLPAEGQVVALLPGSRRGEVQRILPAMLKCAQLLAKRQPGLGFVLPIAGEAVKSLISGETDVAGLSIKVVEGESSAAMTAADVVLLASGTATLEAALLKKPMVITYKLPALSYAVMKRQAYLPWIGLPNILLRRFAVPELIQHEATPEALADAVESWLKSPDEVAALKREFVALHQQLRCNAADRIADALMPYLKQGV
jgi:lipid-A-disaccharide synthase